MQPNVDIVAVHGLEEGPDDTWTWLERSESLRVNQTASKEDRRSLPERLMRRSPSPMPSQNGPPNDKQLNQAFSGLPSNSSSKEVNWLKDPNMLPAAHPEARIMSFGYSTTLGGDKSPADALSQIAKQLLQHLGEKRSTLSCNSQRPIIFIGHRFGGIVIEKALALAAADERHVVLKECDILNSIVGVIFLSTPLRGYKQATLLSNGNRQADSASSAVGRKGSPGSTVAQSKSPDQPGLRSLLYDHKTLNNLYHDFIQTVQTEHIRIACFMDGPLLKKIETRFQVSDFMLHQVCHVCGRNLKND
jgi:hypothetical protein